MKQKQHNMYGATVRKKLKGEKLNFTEEMLVVGFERVFGKCEPISRAEFSSSTADADNEYLDYLKAHTRSIETSMEIMSGVSGVFPMDYNYKSGGILFYDKTHPQYPNMMIIIINDSGEEDAESESLAMKVATRFLDKRYHFIHKTSIVSATMMQHICTDPDCPNCSSKRDTPEIEIPYRIYIECNGSNVPFYAGSFEISLKVVQTILDWQNGIKPIVLTQRNKSTDGNYRFKKGKPKS